MASTTRIQGFGLHFHHRKTVSDAAAAENPQAEPAVPEYAPSLVAFGRPSLAELVELRVQLHRACSTTRLFRTDNSCAFKRITHQPLVIGRAREAALLLLAVRPTGRYLLKLGQSSS